MPLPKIPTFIRKRIFKVRENDEQIILGDCLKDKSKFPPEGIKYSVQSTTHENEKLFPVLAAFYSSIHEDILAEIKGGTIILNFNSYAAVRRNFELMYYSTRKVLRSNGISVNELYQECFEPHFGTIENKNVNVKNNKQKQRDINEGK